MHPCPGFEIIVELLFLSYRYLKTKYIYIFLNKILSILWAIMGYIHFIQTSLSKIQDFGHWGDVLSTSEVNWYGFTHLRVLY